MAIYFFFFLLLSKILFNIHGASQVYNCIISSTNNKNVAFSFRCTIYASYFVILISLNNFKWYGDNRDPWPAVDFHRSTSFLEFYHKTWYYDTDIGMKCVCSFIMLVKYGPRPVIGRFLFSKSGLDIISKTHFRI